MEATNSLGGTGGALNAQTPGPSVTSEACVHEQNWPEIQRLGFYLWRSDNFSIIVKSLRPSCFQQSLVDLKFTVLADFPVLSFKVMYVL